MVLIKYTSNLPIWMGPHAPTVQGDTQTNQDGFMTQISEEDPEIKATGLSNVKKEPFDEMEDDSKEEMNHENNKQPTFIKGEIGDQIDEALTKAEIDSSNTSVGTNKNPENANLSSNMIKRTAMSGSKKKIKKSKSAPVHSIPKIPSTIRIVSGKETTNELLGERTRL